MEFKIEKPSPILHTKKLAAWQRKLEMQALYLKREPQKRKPFFMDDAEEEIFFVFDG